jgi:hypothetical protein
VIPGKGRRFLSSPKRPDGLRVPETLSPLLTRARSEFVPRLKIRYHIPPLPHTSLRVRTVLLFIRKLKRSRPVASIVYVYTLRN